MSPCWRHWCGFQNSVLVREGDARWRFRTVEGMECEIVLVRHLGCERGNVFFNYPRARSNVDAMIHCDLSTLGECVIFDTSRNAKMEARVQCLSG